MRSRRPFSPWWLAGGLVLVWTLASIAQQPPARWQATVTAAAGALVDEGLAKGAPTGRDASEYTVVPPPGVRLVPTVARATNVPWIDTNWWRYERGLRKANYATLPPGSAALAAAEAFAHDVDAVLDPDPADLDDLRSMLRFLASHQRPPLPVRANIGVVETSSPSMDEVLNMLTRRNLLYRVVKAPDPALDLTVRLGSKEFPEDAAANPYEFAALVRAKLGDEKRLVRLYGTNTVLARLTAGEGRARLVLLQFSRGRRRAVTDNPQALQVRLLGHYLPTGFAGYGSRPDARLTDIQHPDGGTEFWVPDFGVIAMIDFDGPK
jgi:hypothetical protein